MPDTRAYSAREFLQSIIMLAAELEELTDEELAEYEKEIRKADSALGDILFAIDDASPKEKS